MAYGIGGDSGFTKPMALSLGWGLLFATLLTLFLIPCMLEVQRESFEFLKSKLLKNNGALDEEQEKEKVSTPCPLHKQEESFDESSPYQ